MPVGGGGAGGGEGRPLRGGGDNVHEDCGEDGVGGGGVDEEAGLMLVRGDEGEQRWEGRREKKW